MPQSERCLCCSDRFVSKLYATCLFGAPLLACRNPRDYFAIFDNVETREADGRYAHFELISCKCVDTYVRIKKNQNQVGPLLCMLD